MTTSSKQCKLKLCLYSVSLDVSLKEALDRHW